MSAWWLRTRSKFSGQKIHRNIGSSETLISAWWLRTRSKFSGQENHRNIGSLETPKQVRIPPEWKVSGSSNKLASDAVRWQEHKYALQQQLQWLCTIKWPRNIKWLRFFKWFRFPKRMVFYLFLSVGARAQVDFFKQILTSLGLKRKRWNLYNTMVWTWQHIFLMFVRFLVFTVLKVFQVSWEVFTVFVRVLNSFRVFTNLLQTRSILGWKKKK